MRKLKTIVARLKNEPHLNVLLLAFFCAFNCLENGILFCFFVSIYNYQDGGTRQLYQNVLTADRNLPDQRRFIERLCTIIESCCEFEDFHNGVILIGIMISTLVFILSLILLTYFTIRIRKNSLPLSKMMGFATEHNTHRDNV